MAKRKPTPEERRERAQRRSDDELLRCYAHHCYQVARAEEAVKLRIPISAVVPVKGKRHRDVLKTTEVAIRKWFFGLPGRARARAKIRVELGIDPKPGYARPSAPQPFKPLTFETAQRALSEIAPLPEE